MKRKPLIALITRIMELAISEIVILLINHTIGRCSVLYFFLKN